MNRKEKEEESTKLLIQPLEKSVEKNTIRKRIHNIITELLSEEELLEKEKSRNKAKEEENAPSQTDPLTENFSKNEKKAEKSPPLESFINSPEKLKKTIEKFDREAKEIKQEEGSIENKKKLEESSEEDFSENLLTSLLDAFSPIAKNFNIEPNTIKRLLGSFNDSDSSDQIADSFTENLLKNLGMEEEKTTVESKESGIHSSYEKLQESVKELNSKKKTIENFPSDQEIIEKELSKQSCNAYLIDLKMLNLQLQSEEIPMYYTKISTSFRKNSREIIETFRKTNIGNIRKMAHYHKCLMRLEEYIKRNLEYCPFTRDETQAFQLALKRNPELPLIF